MFTIINTLSLVYQSVPKLGVLLYSALVSLLIAIFVVKFLIFKKYDILSAIMFVLLIVIVFLDSSFTRLFYVLVISFLVISLLQVCQMIYKYLCKYFHL